MTVRCGEPDAEEALKEFADICEGHLDGELVDDNSCLIDETFIDIGVNDTRVKVKSEEEVDISINNAMMERGHEYDATKVEVDGRAMIVYNSETGESFSVDENGEVELRMTG